MDEVVVDQSEGCWICFNNENNITLTTINSEKLIQNCRIYLDTSIILSSFENVAAAVSCCSYCYKYANQLTLLEEQMKKLQKEISNLSSLFSTNVLERRNRLKIEKNNESSNKSATSKDMTCLSTQKKSDFHSSVNTEKLSVEKEDFEIVSKELPSHTQGKKEIIDFGFDEEHPTKDEIENVIHSEDEIDVKNSYDDFANALSNFSEQNEQMSETITYGDQETLKTSVPDLLKCLKTPVVCLQRLQVGKSSQKTVVYNACVNIKSEIEDADNFGSSISKINDDPNENTVLLNNSVIVGKDNRERPNDYDESQSYECSISGTGFSKMKNLQQHKKLHDEKRPFACHFCDESFLFPSILKTHERIHTGEKPFNCSFCTKSFKRSTHLKEHETIHTGERPFNCSFCPRSFRRATHVRLHELIHTKETPYKCTFCPKSFKRAGLARMHEKMHTHTAEIIEKTHKCSFCPKLFTVASKVKRHELIHTGEKPHKCSICEMTFQRKYSLTSHERKHEETTEEFILP